MKRILLITLIFSGINFSFGQQQIGNSDFESWEAVSSGEEPVNWNSFKTAGGTWSSASSVQVEPSTDTRPGSTGTSSCRIWATATTIPFIGTVVANGNVTLGKINMGSTTPDSPDNNYNTTLTADPNFSEALADTPDSLVFWAKFTPVSGSGNARVRATLHDNYDYHDPEGTGGSANHIVAIAELNYPTTGGNWTRFSIPFDYSVATTANANTHILITFTTNQTPGGGSGDDEVLIDDVELIYNPAGITEHAKGGFVVGMDNGSNNINVYGKEELAGSYVVYNAIGQEVQAGDIASNIKFNKEFGIYFVHLMTKNGVYTFEILKN